MKNLPVSSGLHLSRRRFLRQVAISGGMLFGASSSASGQEPFDRVAADESLKGRLFFWADASMDPENPGVFAYDFETRKWPRVLGDKTPEALWRVSPDGKSFAVIDGDQPRRQFSIIMPDVTTKLSELQAHVFWSQDGRQLVLSEWTNGRPPKSTTWRMNRDGTGRVKLSVPDDELLWDWSPDGRWFLLSRVSSDGKYGYVLRRADGTDPRPLVDDSSRSGSPGRFSPDGSQVAYTWLDRKANSRSVRVVDVASRQERRVFDGDADGRPVNIPCWSPDGKHLAVLMSNGLPANTNKQAWWIDIVDLQGHRIRRLGIPHKYPNPCDWR
jgi:dipeptidyl aminopeptidase/acylaminoacyl peptidase